MSFRSVLVAVAVIVVIAAPHGAAAAPPPFPYTFYQAWTVLTENWLNTKGNSTEQYSYGFHTVVNSEGNGTVCRHGIDMLFPQVPNFTTTIVSNYTLGIENERDMDYNGSVTDCTSRKLEGSMPFGGAWFLAPRLDVFDSMVVVAYTMSGGVNCSVNQWTGKDADGNRQIVQWYVSVDGAIPQVLVNQTFYTTPFEKDYVSRILTTAFVGFEEVDSWPAPCIAPNTCGNEYCAANAGADAGTMQGALSWVCGGYVDCSNISYGGPDYYPNTLVAHASWAFNQYYYANINQGSSGCDFSGTAILTTCTTACTMCNASRTANETALFNALSWVCAHGNIDCSAISPGGDRFLPNTTQAHADYAFNEYYQGYKCIPPQANACDFGGTGAVVGC